jgi:iron uptake system EfeUOB component EfeO/EfeM
MDESELEGTLVLEKLALIGKVDAFYDAVDADDFERAKALMKSAEVDQETIAIILKKMADAE